MIGIVVVSHCRRLAEAAVGLAQEMTAGTEGPAIAIAAGLDETTLGTDAVDIARAITEVDTKEGVLVLMDLGSAVLSAEMALELCDLEVAERVRLSPAPLVEGLMAAVVTASTGADLDTVSAEAGDGLFSKLDHLGTDSDRVDALPSSPLSASVLAAQDLLGPDSLDDAVVFRWRVTNQHGLHARPAAKLVSTLAAFDVTVEISNGTTGIGPVDARSVNRVAALGLRNGHELLAWIEGPEADEALAALHEQSSQHFGDPSASTVADSPTGEMPCANTGFQVVLAPALVSAGDIDTSHYSPSPDDSEVLLASLAGVASELEKRSHGDHGDIFAAQLALLDDPEVVESLARYLAMGSIATDAVRATFAELAAPYDTLSDPYLRERGQDLRSLSRQVLLALMHHHDPDSSEIASHEHVLVVDELDAATAISLDPQLCLGVVTLLGGDTGHGVIVAAGRGVPVMTGRHEAADINPGDLVGLDPRSRQLWIRPDAAQIDQIRQRARDRADGEVHAHGLAHDPAVTRSGLRIPVKANLTSLADAQAAARTGAEGSGLVRTELLWGHLTTAPSAATQADELVAIGQALGGQPITVRTWDVGGDKPLPFLELGPEPNPFLGERGLRSMRRFVEVFDEQLKAIVMAAAQTPVRVMFPMVTEPEELQWAKGRLQAVAESVGLPVPPIGIMIEVPAAALRAGEFAGQVDFVSVGTNDLTQYTCAADRMNSRVAHLGRADSPAVMELIRLTCDALPPGMVSVCGDLASNPEVVAQLIEVGVSELSVRPPLVGVIKDAVRQIGSD